MIRLDKDTYVSKIWTCGDGATGDWLAVLLRRDDEDRWRVIYRFRRYSPDSGESPFASDGDKDEKSWYELMVNSEDAGLSLLTLVSRAVEVFYLHPAQCLVVDGDGAKAMSLIMQQPWAHMSRMEDIGDA